MNDIAHDFFQEAKVSTLITDSTNQWFPNRVDYYKNSIKIPQNTDEQKRLLSNFAYSMQYIEYLEKQISEFKLTSVLQTMVYKSYIITGMGIVELLFVFLLKNSENWNQTEWEEIATFVSNPKEVQGITTKLETKVFRKVSAYDMRMDLDSMIKKVEKRNLLSVDHNVFPVLKQLRELRNRVHLQLGENAYDHDYNCIGLEEIQKMRRILFTILTAPEICKNNSAFQFIYNIYTSVQEKRIL